MIKLTNQKSLTNYIIKQGNKIEKALIYRLEYAIEELTNHAKQNNEYGEPTGNLKASIGGVLLKDGRPITYKGFNDSKDGGGVGLEYINSLVGSYQSGYVILIVAGMEYATYVENYHGLNVLKKSELLIDGKIKEIAEKLKLI